MGRIIFIWGYEHNHAISNAMNEVALRIPDQAQIVDVVTYPVKSLPGVSRPEGVTLTENGLEGDRLFMLAGTKIGENGVAPKLTLREHPELTRINAGYTDDGVALAAEGVGRLILPYDINEGELVAVKSWGGSVTGVRVSSEADKWLGSYLKRDDVQILAVPDHHRRVMAENEQQPDATEFTGRATDGYPLHIVSLASLRRLNEARLQSGLSVLSIEHFRGNIAIDGLDLAAFAEDKLSGMRFEDQNGGVDVVKIADCRRCITVEVDPATGERLNNVRGSIGGLQPERTTSAKLIFGTWAAPSRLSVGGIIRAGQLLKPLPVA